MIKGPTYNMLIDYLRDNLHIIRTDNNLAKLYDNLDILSRPFLTELLIEAIGITKLLSIIGDTLPDHFFSGIELVNHDLNWFISTLTVPENIKFIKYKRAFCFSPKEIIFIGATDIANEVFVGCGYPIIHLSEQCTIHLHTFSAEWDRCMQVFCYKKHLELCENLAKYTKLTLLDK